MKDLVQCSVSRNDFQRWLERGTAPLTIWQDEKADTTLTRLEKSPSVDYLYRIAVKQDGEISWNNSLMFCGVYDRRNQALYLTRDAAGCIVEGKCPLASETVPSMLEEIIGKVNQRVEGIIDNDRNNLSVRKVSSQRMLDDLRYHQKYGAKEEAIQQLFTGEEPDSRFHSDYALDGLREAAFMAYLQDPEGFVQTEAEQYIKSQQEKFLLQFMENDALLTEYHALMRDADNPIHRMKAITEAVTTSGAKSVTVTVQKGGQELTFKTLASSLIGHKNFYSTYDIPASDRREFERLFGRYSDYKAEDITRITYGRNTIYEALPILTEESVETIGPTMQMGGM